MKVQVISGSDISNKTYQQNSNLQGGVHVICIHPWFFSIGRLHFGQGFELASILGIIICSIHNQNCMKKKKCKAFLYTIKEFTIY